MDISTLGIPGIRVRRIGAGKRPIEMVEAPLPLPAWEGYLTKRWDNTRVIEDGTVLVRFSCNTRCTAEDWQADVAAYNYLVEHQEEIRDVITKAVIADLPNLIGYLAPDDPGVPPFIAESSPSDPHSTVRTPQSNDLRPFIGPSTVSILEEMKDGLPYVEWHLNCTWDDEHGLAAVTNGSRLIDLDRGETDIYKIFADNGTLEEELKKAEHYRNQPTNPKPPQPWWKFW